MQEYLYAPGLTDTVAAQLYLNALKAGDIVFDDQFKIKNMKQIFVNFGQSRYQLVAQKKMYFPADGDLDEAIIKGIAVPDNNSLAIWEAKDMLPTSLLAKIIVVFCDKNRKRICTFPLTEFVLSNNGGLIRKTNFKFSSSQSYIIIPDISGLSTSNGVLIKFYY